jgi:hypothetical protein
MDLASQPHIRFFCPIANTILNQALLNPELALADEIAGVVIASHVAVTLVWEGVITPDHLALAEEGENQIKLSNVMFGDQPYTVVIKNSSRLLHDVAAINARGEIL